MRVETHVKCPLLLSNLKKKLDVPIHFRKTPQYEVSSSSSALQPGVGFGLSSFLESFVTMIVLQGGVVNPTPNPPLFWRTSVFCRGCLP
jgi:hypothetical protein